MTLPQPSESDCQAFKDLYKAKFGLELSSEEAQEVARKVIGIVYVQRHSLYSLRQEEFRG